MTIDSAAARWLAFGMLGSSLILAIGLNVSVSSGMDLFRAAMREARFTSPSSHFPSVITLRCDSKADLNINPLEIRLKEPQQ